MKNQPTTFRYTTLFVPEVPAALAFYEEAFGLTRRFLHESGLYGELDTGATTLAFAAHDLARTVVGGPYTPSNPQSVPLGFEIALEPADVPAAYARAVAAGATPVSPPEAKPWGQMVAYVRDRAGVLVALVREL